MKKINRLPKKAYLIMTDNSEFQCDVYLYRLENRFFEVWNYFYKSPVVFEVSLEDLKLSPKFSWILTFL